MSFFGLFTHSESILTPPPPSPHRTLHPVLTTMTILVTNAGTDPAATAADLTIWVLALMLLFLMAVLLLLLPVPLILLLLLLLLLPLLLLLLLLLMVTTTTMIAFPPFLSWKQKKIVVDANEMLVRMTHRGACGCEENTGDGAGILVALPDGFLRKAAVEAGIGELPPKGDYAVGNVFVPKFENAVPEAKAIMERVCKQRGMKVSSLVGWVEVGWFRVGWGLVGWGGVGSGEWGAAGRVGSGRVGSGRVGSGRVGSGRVRSDRVGSSQVRSGWMHEQDGGRVGGRSKGWAVRFPLTCLACVTGL